MQEGPCRRVLHSKGVRHQQEDSAQQEGPAQQEGTAQLNWLQAASASEVVRCT